LVDEWDKDSGGLDVEKANQWLATFNPPLLMVGQINAAWVYGGLAVQTTLDPNAQPFLYDHQIDGTPVLPGVMGTQGFAELVNAIEAELNVARVTNVQFFAPFKFYRMEPQTLHFNMISRPSVNGNRVAHTMLRSFRELGKAGLAPQEKVHFTAEVHLSNTPLDKPTVQFNAPSPNDLPITAERIYQIYFHGPAYQVMDRALVDDDTAIGLMTANLPANSQSASNDAPMSPRLIEFCFQTAGIWEMRTKGVMALPMAIESVTTYRTMDEAQDQRLYAIVKALNNGETFNAVVLDESGNVYVDMTGYRTVQLPGTVTL
jgi:3-hydroxymyristoyl/3-hydroxydecanoyl-(acyl carrier protein) dehydratase